MAMVSTMGLHMDDLFFWDVGEGAREETAADSGLDVDLSFAGACD